MPPEVERAETATSFTSLLRLADALAPPEVCRVHTCVEVHTSRARFTSPTRT